jgi:hypothetical protein
MHSTRIRLVLALAVPVAALPLLAWGCGGSEGETIPATNDGGADSTLAADQGNGGDGTTTNDGGNDTGTVTDGGLGDVRNVVDGRASDPGEIRCGEAGVCQTNSELCCTRVRQDGGAADGGPPSECLQQNQALLCQGRRLRCDEKADCNGQAVCCLELSLQGVTGSACQPQCQGIQPQLCRTDAECNGKACIAQICQGQFVQTCGGIPPSLCP